ncbi:MAG: DUF1566 domain-containing protein, partial [bacterium]
WRPAIQKAIREAHFFVACVSKQWLPTNPQDRKRFFRREIQTALDVLPELPPGDIFIIPIRLEECEVPDSLSLFQWIDYFPEDGWDRLIRAIHTQLARLGVMKPLRSHPARLSKAQVSVMLRELDFFDNDMNPGGKGIKHEYERRSEVILDGATGLMWQQNGSRKKMNPMNASRYLKRLNREKFAGYNDWRLPTLEEAMSLMEPERKNGEFYIDPIFDKNQSWIRTADKETSGAAWLVNFNVGSCGSTYAGYYVTVRAVRAGQ